MAFHFLKTIAVEAVVSGLSRKHFRYNGAAIGLWAGAFIVFMAAFGFAAYAFYLFLLETMSPLAATMTVSASLFGIVIILASSSCYVLGKQNRLQKENAEELRQIITTLVQQGYDEIKEPVQENPALALGISALAGFLANRYL